MKKLRSQKAETLVETLRTSCKSKKTSRTSHSIWHLTVRILLLMLPV